MTGIVTEKHWRLIEKVFPGMKRFYERLEKKPNTFLELEWKYLSFKDQRFEKIRRNHHES